MNFNSKSPFIMLAFLSAGVAFSFSTWRTLLNNFSIEIINFTGDKIGILQSLREIPGFLAFTATFLLFILREQTIAIFSTLLMGFGIAITGYLPTILGLYITTIIMSIGFHYYETMNQSISLQLFSKKETPENLGKLIAISSLSSIIAYALIFILFNKFNISYKHIFLLSGFITIIIALYVYFKFPLIKIEHKQNKKILLRKKYSLYYALVFISGARRQIFVVFASFLMVEKFNFNVSEIAALYFLNGIFTIYLAPKIGKLILNLGEKYILTIEYIGLIIIFTGYSFVDNKWFVILLFIADHIFFNMAIAQKTYFQKIADPKDFAPTAGVAFSINHIAAVLLPIIYGFIWITWGTSYVFYIGIFFAIISLILARMISNEPKRNNEFIWSKQITKNIIKNKNIYKK